jgi:pimeloyl-ACP methyl ester carboxylesterase
MTSSRKSWERLASRLAGRFRVVAYDQRGHGESAALSGPMSLERGVRDAETVAVALGEPVDLLLGHSWGGAIAILAGARLPVRRVAAIDPMIRQAEMEWYDEFLVELRELFALTGDARDAAVRAGYSEWSDPDIKAKIHAVHSMTTLPIENLRDQNPMESWDLRATIERYEKPLLLAFADRGESINADRTLDEIERRAASGVSVAFLSGGHNLHRTEFDAFAKCLESWLALV